MTVASANRAPQPSGLADVLDLILDKGIVIDAYVRLALVGIEILTLDVRVVIASVDTYLRFAEAVNRLDIQPQEQAAGLPGLISQMTEGGGKRKAKGALDGVKESISNALHSDDDEESSSRPRERTRRSSSSGRRPARASSGRDEGDE